MKDFEAASELYSSGISKFASRKIQRGDEVLVTLGSIGYHPLPSTFDSKQDPLFENCLFLPVAVLSANFGDSEVRIQGDKTTPRRQRSADVVNG